MVAAAFAAVKLLLHLATNGSYGYFRDELYYIAVGKHLDWGYPDHAPMIALAAWFTSHVFGDSLHALRLLPALAGAAKVFLTGLICVEMGGGAAAVALACLCVTVAPVYLIGDTLFSMNSFEPVFWMSAVYLVLRAVRRDRPKLLLWAGVALGLGLENKHSAVFFGACLLTGIAFSPQRALLKSRWLWMGIAAAFVIFLPNLIWEYRHDWATLTLLENVKREHKNVELAAPAFLGEQLLVMLPAAALVWLAGLYFALRERALRFIGATFLCFFALMMAMKAKNYYVAPIYPALFAAGGVWWSHRKAWARWALASVIVLMGVALAPFVLPVLPVETLLAYQHRIGFEPPKTEVHHEGPLSQHFGDMFGWPETVEAIARAYDALPPEVRQRTHIFCSNYGEAGAVDFFGPRYGLPKAISAHQSYFLWGPPDVPAGDNLIITQVDRNRAEKACADVEVVGHVGHPYAMGEEHYALLLCRGLKEPLAKHWSALRHWN